jgi:hypothetical protein
VRNIILAAVAAAAITITTQGAALASTSDLTAVTVRQMSTTITTPIDSGDDSLSNHFETSDND